MGRDRSPAEDFGKLLLRITVGGMLLLHGIDKIRFGVDGIGAMLVAKDLPEVLKYGVYVGEVAAPALVILGFMTRLSALAIVANMGMALYLAHVDDVLKLDAHGAWAIETLAFYLLGALAIMFLGPGRMAMWKGDAGPGL